MKYKFTSIIFFTLCYSSLSYAEQNLDKDIVGCWESNLTEYKNTITICVNYDISSIAIQYLNKDEKTGRSEPTICSEPAFVKYNIDNEIIIKGTSGYCRNGREQAALTLKCKLTDDKMMPCELYVVHEDLQLKKVEKKK